ncbi:hypothetical protein [Rhodococcus pyridinivorans]|uniref:Uncharacterized protein n=1 Tax=Rhodococcus pyridinivorans TaxID=103816 RepID=A0A7M2XNT8_9NOCA|nr:hypothetical protein [Rhodococcus pyridinivorans]QOV99546.1 hypothetical protein INP59_03855 [Rhodococcus pyridinivorans]
MTALLSGRVTFRYSSPSTIVEGTGKFAGVYDGFIFFDEARFSDGTDTPRVGVPMVNLIDVRQRDDIETTTVSSWGSAAPVRDTSVVLEVGADQPDPGSIVLDRDGDEWHLQDDGHWYSDNPTESIEWFELLADWGPLELIRDGWGKSA